MLAHSELTPGFYIVCDTAEPEYISVIEVDQRGDVWRIGHETKANKISLRFIRKINMEELEPDKHGTIVSVVQYLRPDGGMSTAEITSTEIAQIKTHADYLEHTKLLHATILRDTGMDCSVILLSWAWFPE